MIKRSERLRTLQHRWERSAYETMSYAEALERFEALWAEARALREDLGRDWLDDLAPDLSIARAVNGLPPS